MPLMLKNLCPGLFQGVIQSETVNHTSQDVLDTFLLGQIDKTT